MFFWTRPTNRLSDLYPGLVEEITPQEYLEIYEKERDNIESVEVIPGRFGDEEFGRILIVKKRPTHKPFREFSSHEHTKR